MAAVVPGPQRERRIASLSPSVCPGNRRRVSFANLQHTPTSLTKSVLRLKTTITFFQLTIAVIYAAEEWLGAIRCLIAGRLRPSAVIAVCLVSKEGG